MKHAVEPTGRKYKAIMHFSKPGSAKGLPWTIHYRNVCHIVAEIVCETPMESEFKPTKKTNPRAFFTTRAAELLIDSKKRAILR